MTVTLRLVLDQVVAPVDPDLAGASAELARALVQTAPTDCEVAAIVPAGDTAVLDDRVPGLAAVTRARLARRELAAAWQLGVATGEAGGLVHAPTLMAPLVRHDRLHDGDQTVVTVWDLAAWDRADELRGPAVVWQRGMLKRAAKHADAVVVPTHAVAERLADLGRFGDRVRVIAGAAPAGFAVPADEVGRRRALRLPDAYVLLAGSSQPSSRLDHAFAALAAVDTDAPIVVIDAPDVDEPAIAAIAAAAGVAESRVHVRGVLDDADRAAVMAAARVFVAPAVVSDFPWRLIEALRVGTPIVATDSPVHRELLVDGGVLTDGTDADRLAGAISEALHDEAAARRLSVLSSDRGRAFSWLGAAERVWQLHAEL